MNENITYTDEPIGEPKVVPDFLPSPAGLVFEQLPSLFAGLPEVDTHEFLRDIHEVVDHLPATYDTWEPDRHHDPEKKQQ